MTLSAAEARRIAVAAAGLAAPRPRGQVTLARARRTAQALGVIQIDAVNVLARAHEMPLFSRLGSHEHHLLPRLVADGHLVEAWAHEASFIRADHYPLFDWRRRAPHAWGLSELARRRPELVAALEARIAADGPLTAGEITANAVRRGPWWGWDDTKRALEALFWSGRLAVRRRADFSREYGLPEQVLPAAARAEPPPDDEARRALVVHAATTLGVATAGDLADYHRQTTRDVRPALAALVQEGGLEAVRVEGWREPGYLHPDARRPRRVSARALVSPFDPLVWSRARTERIFGFHYRIEIYTPAAKRVHGYYVLPFLLRDRLVARVDLKADRAAGVLRVLAAHREPGAPSDTAEALAAELTDLAAWRGLHRVEVADRGDLAPALAAAVPAAQPAG